MPDADVVAGLRPSHLQNKGWDGEWERDGERSLQHFLVNNKVGLGLY